MKAVYCEIGVGYNTEVTDPSLRHQNNIVHVMGTNQRPACR
jgi:hypothetical protein